MRVNGAHSSTYRATSGVPQGSVLGPLLFSAFVNDVEDVIKHSFLLLYANAIKLFREIGSVTDGAKLQEDVHSIEIWFLHSRLPLNRRKTKVTTYSRKTSIIHFHTE